MEIVTRAGDQPDQQGKEAMRIASYMERWGHEEFAVWTDKAAGLRAFIAIHDTTLGPALGGCRVWPHRTEDQAITDALRLARAMTYKSAAAGLPLGGGKALIMADPRQGETEAMFRSLGRFVQSLGGRYVTTEDVGSTPQDMVHIARETSHVVGLPVAQGGSGDPSAMTGFGVYQGMRACAKAVWGSASLSGRRVAMQGYGKVAGFLAQHLLKEEVHIITTDIYEPARARAAEQGLEVLEDGGDIFDVACDIFAPCALGGVLNGDTIPQLKCEIVCGAANNQLLDVRRHGDALQRRDILYAPDYVVNAGGVINLSFEIGRSYDVEAAKEKTAAIFETMERVLSISARDGISTARAADRLAEERLTAGRH